MKRKATPSELATVNSHRAAATSLEESEYDKAVILEDDVHLAPDFAEAVINASACLPPSSLLRLEATNMWSTFARKPVEGFEPRVARRLCSAQTNAAAYMVDRDAALLLSKRLAALDQPVDRLLASPRGLRKSGLSLLQLFPSPCIQDRLLPVLQQVGFRSSIDRTDHQSNKFKGGSIREASRDAQSALLRPFGLQRLRPDFG